MNRWFSLVILILQSSKLDKSDSFSLHHAPHLDVFKWVARDSYLPQGSQGLKEVTRLKLQYQPVEVAPEEMVEKALKEPQVWRCFILFLLCIWFYFLKFRLWPPIPSPIRLLPTISIWSTWIRLSFLSAPSYPWTQTMSRGKVANLLFNDLIARYGDAVWVFVDGGSPEGWNYLSKQEEQQV